jgi:DNA-binding transcriptional MocR family regulator
VRDLYTDRSDTLADIFQACSAYGNRNRVFYFASTSKISFPGSGVAIMAASEENLKQIMPIIGAQTIGFDKIDQLRHVRFFGDIHGMIEHMRKHADILRPKFEAVLEILERELGGLGIGEWTKPKGGYFISFDSLDGCAKDIVAKCKKAGVVMTGAGATYPYGKDPHDSNIRIAPSYPPLNDLIIATELFTLCVKLSSVNKLLSEMD